MGKTFWYILGAFAVYWYLIAKRTTSDLVSSVRGQITGFAGTNQAGQATGAIADPGTHDSYPGASIEPAPVKAYPLYPSNDWRRRIASGKVSLPGGRTGWAI